MNRIEWGPLVALEATSDEIATHAAALAAGYNDPDNAPLMGHTSEISPAEVVDSYKESIAAGMRAFLLFAGGGALVGDADLRNLRDGAAEFAFMIGSRTMQGKGLGTKFATMIHAFGFRELDLHHIYVSVVPHNGASMRVFEKLGYVVDDSPVARAYAEEPDDVVLSLDKPTFMRSHAARLRQIQIAVR